MIVMEDGGAFLAITRPGESVVRVPLSQRDLLRLVGEAARAATCSASRIGGPTAMG